MNLHYKYVHMGCPALHYEDVCEHPEECADRGRCQDLPQPRGFDDNEETPR